MKIRFTTKECHVSLGAQITSHFISLQFFRVVGLGIENRFYTHNAYFLGKVSLSLKLTCPALGYLGRLSRMTGVSVLPGARPEIW